MVVDPCTLRGSSPPAQDYGEMTGLEKQHLGVVDGELVDAGLVLALPPLRHGQVGHHLCKDFNSFPH